MSNISFLVSDHLDILLDLDILQVPVINRQVQPSIAYIQHHLLLKMSENPALRPLPSESQVLPLQLSENRATKVLMIMLILQRPTDVQHHLIIACQKPAHLTQEFRPVDQARYRIIHQGMRLATLGIINKFLHFRRLFD